MRVERDQDLEKKNYWFILSTVKLAMVDRVCGGVGIVVYQLVSGGERKGSKVSIWKELQESRGKKKEKEKEKLRQNKNPPFGQLDIASSIA